jgi:hypothetical protein
MKKVSLIIALAFITNLSFSQEMKTLFKKDTTKTESYGGYGAPMVGASMMGKYWGVMVGGKGGLIRNHHFGVGGIGAAIIGNSSSSMTDTIAKIGKDSTFTHNLSMGYGGIYLEYIFNYDSPIHVSLPLNICVGGVWAGGDHSSGSIKSSSVFIVEPGINFEFNFAKHFVPALNVSYKIVTGNSSNLSGVNVGLIFKLGKF